MLLLSLCKLAMHWRRHMRCFDFLSFFVRFESHSSLAIGYILEKIQSRRQTNEEKLSFRTADMRHSFPSPLNAFEPSVRRNAFVVFCSLLVYSIDFRFQQCYRSKTTKKYNSNALSEMSSQLCHLEKKLEHQKQHHVWWKCLLFWSDEKKKLRLPKASSLTN